MPTDASPALIARLRNELDEIEHHRLLHLANRVRAYEAEITNSSGLFSADYAVYAAIEYHANETADYFCVWLWSSVGRARNLRFWLEEYGVVVLVPFDVYDALRPLGVESPDSLDA